MRALAIRSAKAAADPIRRRTNNRARLMARVSAVAALLLLAALPAAADFDAGVAAFQRGNYDVARDEWRPLAESGQSNAQFNLALLHANGFGVPRSPDEARRWFAAAAEQGNTQAQYNLALMLQAGDGIERDIRGARRWYEKAARDGLAAAQNNLGLMYLNGDGMPADTARAIRWLGRAAGTSAQAQRNLDQLAESLPGARVTGSRVNVRAGPSRQSQVLAQVGSSDAGLLLDSRAGWSRLWFVERETIGWIADRLLALGGDAPQAEAEQATAVGSTAPADVREKPVASSAAEEAPEESDERTRFKVASASAQLREGAARDASVSERLTYGTEVVVLGHDGGWRRIRVPTTGAEGWVSAFVLAWDEAAEAEVAARRASAPPATGSGGG